MKQTQWWKKSVVYQIYPRSFCDSNGDGIGDLKGIISKLDYLKTLGVDVLWLCPIYQSPNDDNGYDISDYQAIMKEFGTMDDFDELLAQSHTRGLRIVMDLVVNHSSDEHRWFVESRQSKDNPYRDYYIWQESKADGSLPNNWGSWFSGPAWEYDSTTDSYYLHIFSRKQPDLNWDNPRLRDEIFTMMRWWLDKGIDGFRMDVINLISKTEGLPDGPIVNGSGDLSPLVCNGPHVHDYLKEMNAKVLSHYDIMTVGETPNVDVETAHLYTDEDRHELNMVFQFEHMGIDMGPYGKWTDRRFALKDLKEVLSKWQTGMVSSGWNSLYWNNHDQPRVISRFGCDSKQWREKSGKMLATLLHMMKGTPYIYQGEEIGMTNVAFDKLEDYRDIEILNAYHDLVTTRHLLSHEEMMRGIHSKGRDNARTPMQWNDQPQAGFTTGTPWIKVNPNYVDINAKKALANTHSIFYYYQKLIALRKSYDIIIDGDYQLLLPDDEHLFVYKRCLDKQELLVICNFTDQPQTVCLNEEMENSILLISNDEPTAFSKEMTLRPYEARVYYQKAK
ncbi:MAG TPA: alpha-glucosidase [Candidatus Fimiplasma intestinipullorum]|uniref:Alpha-glucosidase n=1 Tax=Candidatus Fimiplasma intestinipullorum TaxID=2840825 RepID=A0A9D1L092_9FIRM|nr:alpha-glucosidase [Candidatus Fimiplasma intestinipullorum]